MPEPAQSSKTGGAPRCMRCSCIVAMDAAAPPPHPPPNPIRLPLLPVPLIVAAAPALPPPGFPPLVLLLPQLCRF